MTVKELAKQLNLWGQIQTVVSRRLPGPAAQRLLEQVASLPVRRSRAVRNLGTYVSNASGPIAIRLQFALEPEVLRETFLHELAHACDHLTAQAGRKYRRAHGPDWREWAELFGIKAERCGQSEALAELQKERLKVVAVCQRCGTEIRRLRRLNRRRTYLHQQCGGRLKQQ